MVALRCWDQAPSPPAPQAQGVSPPPVLLPVALWVCILCVPVSGGVPLTPSGLLSRDPQSLPGQPASWVAVRLQTFSPCGTMGPECLRAAPCSTAGVGQRGPGILQAARV